MIFIDGSHGEGGGQIVRTSVALSVALGKPVRVSNIRSGRRVPGLKAQHLWAIKALAELTNARVEGLSLGSESLLFEPSDWSSNFVSIEIPTAGSIGLVIQCLLPALVTAPEPVNVSFRGGASCGKWSPPVDFIQHVLFPNLALFGVKPPELKVTREGYYPKGGAIVDLTVFPSKVSPYYLTEYKIDKVSIYSHASSILSKQRVVERQAQQARELLSDFEVSVEERYSDSLSAGSCLTIIGEGESVIGADSLGERGKTSEQVASEAVSKFLKENGAVDVHSADMLTPFMALAGGGELITSEVSSHAHTNAWVCSQFTGREFTLEKNKIKL